MVQFLKYVSLRLFIGTLVAAFAVYRTLAWVHESLYAGRSFDDNPLILWLYLTVLIVVSIGMSVWGRVRFRSILEHELDRVSREYNPKTLIRAYRRLTGYLTSFFFFNTSRDRLAKVAARRFGDILLGMRIEDDEALEIYEDILIAEPDNESYYAFLVRACSRRPRLSERGWKFIRRRYHERPDDRLVGLLSREYTLRGVLNFESERVLERCLQVFPQYRDKVLGFVVPRLASFQRTDDNAVRFYLAALEAGWGDKVLPLLERIQAHYRDKKRSDALALAVSRAVKKGGPGGRNQGEGLLEGIRTELEPQPEYEGFSLEGLVFSPEEELEGEARTMGLNLRSRLYQNLQRLIAGGRGTVGGWGRWVRLVLLVVLTGVLIYLLGTVGRRTLRAFRPETSGQAELLPPEEVLPEAGATGGPWFAIQVGSFRDSLSAVAMAEHVKSAGVKSYVGSAKVGGRGTIFRVLIGPYPSDSAAGARARNMQSSGLISDWRVVEYAGGGK